MKSTTSYLLCGAMAVFVLTPLSSIAQARDISHLPQEHQAAIKQARQEYKQCLVEKAAQYESQIYPRDGFPYNTDPRRNYTKDEAAKEAKDECQTVGEIRIQDLRTKLWDRDNVPCVRREIHGKFVEACREKEQNRNMKARYEAPEISALYTEPESGLKSIYEHELERQQCRHTHDTVQEIDKCMTELAFERGQQRQKELDRNAAAKWDAINAERDRKADQERAERQRKNLEIINRKRAERGLPPL